MDAVRMKERINVSDYLRIHVSVLLAVQVGVLAPHDHVWSLHYNHEVGLLKEQSTTSVVMPPHKGQTLFAAYMDVSISKHYLNGCRFNSQILAFVTRQLRSVKPCCPGSEDHRDDKMGEDASACNTSMVLLNKGQKTLK